MNFSKKWLNNAVVLLLCMSICTQQAMAVDNPIQREIVDGTKNMIGKFGDKIIDDFSGKELLVAAVTCSCAYAALTRFFKIIRWRN